ncbi:MAG: protein kinase [Ardenticatenaceae bacterium]|nr:protein kinase [Ardenticatenaceae bacterium]MCB9443715.1 protein kinase [Ardenticatenaceae bacterium]
MNDDSILERPMPQKIGRYLVQSLLGQGGMAVVYRAIDPRFEREVAIKILSHELLPDPQFRQRFDREAKMIAALEHPFIVPVHDFGDQDGQPYLVMRLMSGGTLTNRLESGPLPLPKVAQIVQRLSSALAEAHKRGVIHRDLKPGNVLFDQYDLAYLSDFGIARMTERSSTLTGGNTMGTPGYMSPEQIEGQPVDGRSDIYALGVLTYEMVTGRRPFEADTPMMVMVKQMTEQAPRLADLRNDLPLEYDLLLEKTMAREPAKRPSSVIEVSEMLFAATRASRQAEPPTMVTSSDPSDNPAKVATQVAPELPAATPRPPARAYETKSVLLIACPSCQQPIDIHDHGESIHCPSCNRDFALRNHTCPNCYHYHEAKTAVCQQCGESINRVCRQCHTANWGGDETCTKCGAPLDIFELMYSHSSKATVERLQRQMSEAADFKKVEEAASQKRMEEMKAIERERQAELYRRRQKRQQEERTLMFLTVGILLAVSVIAVFYFIFF